MRLISMKPKHFNLNRKCIYFIVTIFLFAAMGFFSSRFLWRQFHYCLHIQIPRSPFYALFAQKLKSELEKSGYSFTCPSFFPKTALEFISTNKNQPSAAPMANGMFHTKIAIIGDCSEGFDYPLLDTYDLLLPVNEYHHGYLTQFNYRTAFFPLSKNSLCNMVFNEKEINVSEYAVWIDKVLQGFLHEKL